MMSKFPMFFMEIPRMSVRVVRIFTSSTFTDTFHERNTLMEKVYPKLKSFCQELGYDFQVVDMRWGVREMAENEHTNTELCLKEIRACQKFSIGPTFVSFLSHKYGYRPFPREIKVDHFQLITQNVSPDQQQLIDKWFLRDSNSKPEVYVLQPISTRFPDFISDDQDLYKKAKNKFWDVFLVLQGIIFEGAKKYLSPEDARHYLIAVTEREVLEGVVRDPNSRKHCLWFKRVIQDIDEQPKSKQLSRYYECLGDEEKLREARAMLHRVRDDVMLKAMPHDNITEYRIKWAEKGVDPTQTEHQEYLNSLCVDFETKMKELINVGLSDGLSQEVQRDPIYTEIIHHTQFCRDKCRQFSGRQSMIERVEDYVCGRSCHPFILHGDSGCGKTSLLAVSATQGYHWMGRKGAVIFRFLGTSPGSSSIRQLLCSLNHQLRLLYLPNLPVFYCQPSGELQILIQGFQQLLASVSKDKPLLLVLDGLDQLDGADGGRHLHWLPSQLPANVKILLSTLPQEKYGCFPRCKALFPDASGYLEVKTLDVSDLESILSKWLHGIDRQLTPPQHSYLLGILTSCPSPLFLKLSFDEARQWHSYDLPDKTRLEVAILPAIFNLFEKIEKQHGQLLVMHALAYLTAAKFGLTESEIEDMLSLSDVVLNDVYQYWKPPVRRLPPLLWVRIKYDLEEYLIQRSVDQVRVIYWYHRQFVEVAEARYLSHTQTKQQLHSELADYFSGTWAEESKPYKDKKGNPKSELRYVAKQPLLYDNGKYNLRRLNQLPYHLIQAKQLDRLKGDVVCNFLFMLSKITAVGIGHLLSDLKEAQRTFPDDQDINIVLESLQLSHGVLSDNPSELAGQLVGRMHMNNASNTSVMSEARRAIEGNMLEAEAAVMAATLLDMMNGIVASQSDKHAHVLSLLEQARRSVTPMLLPHTCCLLPPGGQLLHKIVQHWDKINDIDVAPDGFTFASCSDDNTVMLWNTTYADLISSVNIPDDVESVRFYPDSKHIVALTLRNLYIIDIAYMTILHEVECTQGKSDQAAPVAVCTSSNTCLLILLSSNQLAVIDGMSGKTISRMQDGLDQQISAKFNDKKHLTCHKHYVIYAAYKANAFYILPMTTPTSTELHRVTVFPKALTYTEITSDAAVSVPYISALCVAESLKGRDVVVVCDGTTQVFSLFDLLTEQLVMRTPGEADERVTQCFFSPINQYLYYTSEDNVGILNFEEGKRKLHFAHPCEVKKVAGLNGMHVVTQGADNVLRVWDQRMAPFTPDMSSFTGKVAIKSDRNRAMAEQLLNAVSSNFDIDNPETLSSVITSSDSKNYWSRDTDEFLLAGQRLTSRFHVFPSCPRYLAVSQSTQLRDVEGWWSHCLTVWDLSSVQCVRRIFLPPESLYVHFITALGEVILAKMDEFRSTPLVKANPADFSLTLLSGGTQAPEKNRQVKHFHKNNVFVAQSACQCLTVYSEDTGEPVYSHNIPDDMLNHAMALPRMRMEHLAFTQIHMKEDGSVVAVWANTYICTWSNGNAEPASVIHVQQHLPLYTSHNHSLTLLTSANARFLLITINRTSQQIANKDTTKGQAMEVLLHDYEEGMSYVKSPVSVSGCPDNACMVVPLLQQRVKGCSLVLMAVTSSADVVIVDEKSLASGLHEMRVDEGSGHLVTFSGSRLLYWRQSGHNLLSLGSFTLDEQVDDAVLVDEGRAVVVNVSTGIVRLDLVGKDTEPGRTDYSSMPTLFTDQLLNMEL